LVSVHLYFKEAEKNLLRREIRYIPLEEAKKSLENLATIIVQELIKGPDKSTGLITVIPEGTKLIKSVLIQDSTAIVDLSPEFISRHQGGKEAEALTIYSVVNSLTELKELQNVKFLINGKVNKEYKGNFKFDALFPRTPSIISDEPALRSRDMPVGSVSKGSDEILFAGVPANAQNNIDEVPDNGVIGVENAAGSEDKYYEDNYVELNEEILE